MTAQRPPAAKLLETPGGLLTRSDLRELGLDRRAVDAVFRECPVIILPGYRGRWFAARRTSRFWRDGRTATAVLTGFGG
jgi:hypothetical protein